MKNKVINYKKLSRILIIINIIIIILTSLIASYRDAFILFIMPNKLTSDSTICESLKLVQKENAYNIETYQLFNSLGEINLTVAQHEDLIGIIGLTQTITGTKNLTVNTNNLTYFYEASLNSDNTEFYNILGSSTEVIKIPQPYYEKRFNELNLNNLTGNETICLDIKCNGYSDCKTEIKSNEKKISTVNIEDNFLVSSNIFYDVNYTITTDSKSINYNPRILFKKGIVGDLDFDGEFTLKDLEILTRIIANKNNDVNLSINFLDINQDGEVDANDVVQLNNFIKEPDEVNMKFTSGIVIEMKESLIGGQ